MSARVLLSLAASRPAWRRHATLRGVVLLPTLYLLVLYVLPAGIMPGYSFWSMDHNYKLVPVWNLAEYRYFLTQPAYSLLLVRSFRTALLNTVTSLAIAYPLAYLLAYAARGRWKNLMLVMLIAPSWTSFLIRIYAWMLILCATVDYHIALASGDRIIARQQQSSSAAAAFRAGAPLSVRLPAAALRWLSSAGSL